jgi:predicted dehydrogenase
LTRRKLLRLTAAGVALGSVPVVAAELLPWRVLMPKPRSAQDINLAIIGAGGYGLQLIHYFAKTEGCQIGYVCDPDEARGQAAVTLVQREFGRNATYFRDMRRVYDAKDVNAVVIATPNHWHTLAAVWAMQAEKDVYVEKPVSHSIDEGRRLADASERYQRIVQSGLQLRSYNELRRAIDFLIKGGIGKINYARCLSYKRRRPIGEAGDFPPPNNVDYDLWCGPAPMSRVTRREFHYDWHWFWDYGGGGLSNNGVHRIDVARWGMGLTGLGDAVLSFGGRFGPPDSGETPNTQVTIHRYGDRYIIHELRGLPTSPDPMLEDSDGVIFYGTEGILTFASRQAILKDLKGRVVKRFARREGGSLHRNFLDAVRSRSRQDLHCDALNGHYSSALCHLGGLSHRLGNVAGEKQIERQFADAGLPPFVGQIYSDAKDHLRSNGIDQPFLLGRFLRFDSEGKEIFDDPHASSMLRVDYRKPYVLPDLA